MLARLAYILLQKLACTLIFWQVIRIEACVSWQRLQICPPQMVETKILEQMPDIHFALSSRTNEVAYLRQVADYLIGHLLDESRIAGRASDDDSPLYNTNTANVVSSSCLSLRIIQIIRRIKVMRRRKLIYFTYFPTTKFNFTLLKAVKIRRFHIPCACLGGS